ncbi:hypothetical protein ACQY0O_000603 [Thecaphora frezii]|uniref:BZIP domain-containing protein n=1 Tax=Thecaphora frezii TaxID=1269715 RepID=A0A8T9MY66_9BASI|nr:hypothetical protein [Thecaphora frezii]
MASPATTSSPRPLAAKPNPPLRPQPLAAKPVAISPGPSTSGRSNNAVRTRPSPNASASISNTSAALPPSVAPRPAASRSAAVALSPAGSSGSTSIKAAPPLKPSESSSSSASSSLANKAASMSAAAPLDKKQGSGPSIQPSKEWVLPARAKPGRKPSETEPPTKRKAQNRASQRAFRERKQMYLADLEAKVAAYEKAEIDRSVEIQKAAKRLKEENDALKKENAALKEKCSQLEAFVTSIRSGGKTISSKPSSSRSGPGCKAPAHEARSSVAPRKGAMVTASSKGSNGTPKGEVRFAEEVGVKVRRSSATQRSDAAPPESSASSSSQVAPQAASQATLHAPSSHPSLLPSSSAEPKPSSAIALPISAKRSSVTSQASTPLWNVQPAAPPVPSTSSARREKAILSPPLMGKEHAVPIEGGCGFCTEASPCVCADDFLNLDSSEKGDSPKSVKIKPTSTEAVSAASLDAPGAVPLPRKPLPQVTEGQAASMRIDSLTNAMTPGRGLGRNRLWYTVPPADEAPSVCPTSNSRAMASPSASSKKVTKKKLWYTVPASSPQDQPYGGAALPSLAGSGVDPFEPVCTGDPSTCGACSTDPGLAAFCEAVTNSVRGSSTVFTSWDAGNAIPLPSRARSNSTAARAQSSTAQRPSLGRFSTTGRLQSTSNLGASGSRHLDPAAIAAPSSYQGPSPRHQIETITSAWKQIRSHPHFNQWQGGLDLLAEVVSRRSGSVHSPLLGERERQRDLARAVSVEIEPIRRTSTGNVESHDRATKTTHDGSTPQLLHAASDTNLLHPTMQIKRERDVNMDIDPLGADDDGQGAEVAAQTAQARKSKRRRILVEREAVQEALALLDRGTAQFPLLTSGLPRRDSGAVGTSRDYAALDASGAGRHEHGDADGPCPCPWWRPSQPYSGPERRT